MKRRLAAILSADVVGYTRLMGHDEAGTFRRLTKLRQEVLEPLVAQHHGRVVKLIGDGLLVEFASVVDALNCAVAWQNSVSEREAVADEDKRLQFRIGINLGDVIVEGDDIHGDGVNIAARLEGLAEPDGICLSGDAYRQGKGKVEVNFEDLGEQVLKNVAEPVRVYRVTGGHSGGGMVSPAMATLSLPDKPSIAVLPFENMSGDPEQEYFSDGITEDIITGLSRFPLLFVIARNSSFTYKGLSVDVTQIAEELGVRYVVEGSVRKAGDRIRLTAQMVDATNGAHVWAERYDRDVADIFDIQDGISERIVSAIGPEFMTAEMKRAHRQREANPDAWASFMHALWHLARYTREDLAEVHRLSRQSIAQDPTSARPHALIAIAHVVGNLYGWEEDQEATFAAANEAAERAVALDPLSSLSARTMGHVSMFERRHEDAVRHYRRAIELCPSEADNHALLGVTLGQCGDHESALKHVERACRMSPRDPFSASWFSSLATSAIFVGGYEEAVEWAHRAIQVNPQFPGGHRSLASALGHLRREDEAQAALRKLVGLLPGVSLAQIRCRLPIAEGRDLEHYLDGLRIAGLREE